MDALAPVSTFPATLEYLADLGTTPPFRGAGTRGRFVEYEDMLRTVQGFLYGISTAPFQDSHSLPSHLSLLHSLPI